MATLKDAEHQRNLIGAGNVHILTVTYFENLQQEFDRITSGMNVSETK